MSVIKMLFTAVLIAAICAGLATFFLNTEIGLNIVGNTLDGLGLRKAASQVDERTQKIRVADQMRDEQKKALETGLDSVRERTLEDRDQLRAQQERFRTKQEQMQTKLQSLADREKAWREREGAGADLRTEVETTGVDRALEGASREVKRVEQPAIEHKTVWESFLDLVGIREAQREAEENARDRREALRQRAEDKEALMEKISKLQDKADDDRARVQEQQDQLRDQQEALKARMEQMRERMQR